MLTSPDSETSPAATDPILVANFDTPPRLISELVVDPNFPKSALGLHVDIGGVTGVITEIVKHSVKLRTPEGQLMSFNAFTLCKLYAPAPRFEPAPPPVEVPATTGEDSEPEEPEQEFLAAPDFTQPLQPMSDWVQRADFPQGALGAHVDLGGYSGVVVQVVRQSLRILSQEGDLRSYNAAVLRKLHGGLRAARAEGTGS
jgi:hypothetical protein